MFCYLGSCLTSSISAIFARDVTSGAKFFTTFKVNTNAMYLLLHVDILNFIIIFALLFLYNRFQRYSKQKINYVNYDLLDIKRLLAFSLPVLAGIMKTHLLSFIKPTSIVCATSMLPFSIAILSYFLLNARLKKNFTFAFFLCLIGFFLAKNGNITDFYKQGSWLLAFILFKSIGYIVIHKYCKTRDIMTNVTIDTFVFFFYACIILLSTGNLKLSILFSSAAFLMTVVVTMNHIFMILGYKFSQNISDVQILDFSKVIFTHILSYFVAGELITMTQFYGIIIMGIVLYKYQKNLL